MQLRLSLANRVVRLLTRRTLFRIFRTLFN